MAQLVDSLSTPLELAVVREERVADAAVLETNFLRQSAAEAHDNRALNLRAKVGWVLDRPALKGLNDFNDLDLALRPVGLHFSACRHIGAFLNAARQANATRPSLALPAFPPAKPLRRRFQNSPQAIVGEMRQPEGQRISSRARRQLIHE